MIEDCGNQARCSCDLGRDYDTLCDELCSVVATTAIHRRNHEPFLQPLFLASCNVVTTTVFHGFDYNLNRRLKTMAVRLGVVATLVATMAPCVMNFAV